MTNPRVLILDDEPMVAQTIAIVCASVGAQTQETQDPEVFFQLIDDWLPTHVCIDLNMPVMDGLAVLAELGRRGCTAAVIVGSGVSQRVLEAAGRAATAHGLQLAGVLPKPFRAGDIQRLLERDIVRPEANAAPPRPLSAFEPTAQTLRHAIEHDQLTVLLQPKVVCADGRVCGFEALVRWEHPEHGTIAPDSFIALAERVGLVDALTLDVVHRALAWFAPWATARGDAGSATLSVNISASSLGNQDLFDSIEQSCRQHGVSPSQMIFELTETAAMDDPTAALVLLTRLRMHGFQLSIDDFGTGFSSMLQLVRMPFSELKIDRSFVMNALESEESRTVIRCMVDLARSLGLSVTAEGVENRETFAMLQLMGCDTAQGYFISRPMRPEICDAWCTAQGDKVKFLAGQGGVA